MEGFEVGGCSKPNTQTPEKTFQPETDMSLQEAVRVLLYHFRIFSPLKDMHYHCVGAQDLRSNILEIGAGLLPRCA